MWLGVGDVDSALVQTLAAAGGDAFESDYGERVGHTRYEVGGSIFRFDGDDPHPFGHLVKVIAVVVVHEVYCIMSSESFWGLGRWMVDTFKHEVSELGGHVTHGVGHANPRFRVKIAALSSAVPRGVDYVHDHGI